MIQSDEIRFKKSGEVPGEIRFGTIAISKGFITNEQFVNAIQTQLKGEVERGEHKLIGEILVEMGA